MGFSLNRHAATGAVYLVAGTVIQAAVGLAASIALARIVGPEAFGRFAATLAAVGLTYTVLSLRVSVLISRAAPEEIAGLRGRTYCTALALESAFGATVATAILAATGSWDSWALTLVFTQAIAHWVGGNRAFYERSMPYRRLALAETSTAVGGHFFALGIALVGFGEAALYLRELVTALGLLAILAATGGLTFLPWRWLRRGDWRALIREGRSVWLEGMMEGSFHRLTTLVVSAIATERETGYFFMAQSLAARPHQFLSPIAARVASNWFRLTADALARRQGRNRLLAWLLIPLTICTTLVVWQADPIVPLILGPEWRGAVPVLITMSGMIIFLTLFEVLRSYSIVMRRESHVLWARAAQYVSFLAAVCVGLAFLPGVMALGLAVSAAFMAAGAALWFMAAREHPP